MFFISTQKNSNNNFQIEIQLEKSFYIMLQGLGNHWLFIRYIKVMTGIVFVIA